MIGFVTRCETVRCLTAVMQRVWHGLIHNNLTSTSNPQMNSFVISSSWLGLFSDQLTIFALITFNTEEETLKYLAKDTEAAAIAQLDNS
jgi:hypothetical protein